MSSDYATKITSMLEQGQDPKDFMIEVCKPSCKNYEDKLRRCQTALKNMTHVDPEMTCMYPLRDWVTCVDGCVQPKIHSRLVGNKPGRFI